MRVDREIQRQVEEELLARRPEHEENVEAAVHLGVVRLTGYVDSYCEKYSIEQTVRAIADVAGVVNEIETRWEPSTHPSDAELRCEVLRALMTEVPSIHDRLAIEVHDGAVTLRGVVDCHFLRERAENAVRRLGRISTVHNAIELEAEALAREVQRRIDEPDVHASASQGEVKLSGSVASADARTRAERAAWTVPCVVSVRNELAIR